MKTGVILYLLGGGQGHDNVDMACADLQVKGLTYEPDCVRLGTDAEELVDYWKEMTVQGMKRIVCMLARVQRDNVLQVCGSELVLSGY